MNGKITKKRLTDFLSYEWIIMVIVCVASIFALEFIFTVFSVTPTTGQYFKYYYDDGVDSSSDNRLKNLLTENNTFSFDVLEVDFETVSAANDVLSAKLNVYEGDVIITRTNKKDGEVQVRAKSIIDRFSVCSLDKLLKEAEEYLKTLVKDGGNIYDFADMDLEKIDGGFYSRLKDDNRFRSEEQKQQGISAERARISTLCENVKYFKAFLDSASDDMFFTYTRYEQAKDVSASASEKEKFTDYYNQMIEQNLATEGREELRYGIKLNKLTGGKNVSEFFRVNATGSAENLTILVFDFVSQQPELQFESISFLCTIISECSNFTV